MRIGIFAGTFDPVHTGHLDFAKTAINSALLDKVVLVAEKEPYRKKPYASWDHRQAMISRATEKISQVDHDYKFAATLARQHTMKNMCQAAVKHYGPDIELWFLVGSDVFEFMSRWEDIVQSDEYGGFVVALREDHTKEWLIDKCLDISMVAGGNKCSIVPNFQPYISSSRIRSDIAKGLVNDSIPEGISDYMLKHKLYHK